MHFKIKMFQINNMFMIESFFKRVFLMANAKKTDESRLNLEHVRNRGQGCAHTQTAPLNI